MNKKILKIQDVRLHHMASTYEFPLFWYGNRLLRSCNIHGKQRLQKILALNLPTIQPAVETEFLIDLAEIPDIIDKSRLHRESDIDGLDVISPVYEHKNYEHRIHIQETYLGMRKEMISAVCQLNAKLTEHNMIAVDVHEMNINVTIDGIKWLDYGSIKDIDEHNCLRSFVEIGYLLGRHFFNKYQDLQERLTIDVVKTFSEELANIAKMDFTKPETWIVLDEYVKSLPVPDLMPTHWSDEYTMTNEIDNPNSRNDKGKNYWSLLQDIEFDTVTDVACNKGYFGFLAAKKAKSVIGFDVDSKCICMADELNKEFKLPAIFAIKTIEEFINNENFETSRYKSDLVVALAIVHHLKIQKMPAVDFVNMLDSICNRYIILEDVDEAEVYETLFLERGYELVKRIDSSPVPRTLSLYRKL